MQHVGQAVLTSSRRFRRIDLRYAEWRKGVDDLHGLQTDRDHLPNEAEDVLRILVPIGIVGDAAAFVG